MAWAKAHTSPRTLHPLGSAIVIPEGLWVVKYGWFGNLEDIDDLHQQAP